MCNCKNNASPGNRTRNVLSKISRAVTRVGLKSKSFLPGGETNCKGYDYYDHLLTDGWTDNEVAILKSQKANYHRNCLLYASVIEDIVARHQPQTTTDDPVQP